MNIETCRQLFKKFPGLETQSYFCYSKKDGGWDNMTYTKGQNGYKWASKHIPAPEVEELLALFSKPISMTVQEYQRFKEDEWIFLANQLIKEKN